MSSGRLALLTALALVCFAGNSLLCRAALGHGGMDPASFTAIRLASGAVMLVLLLSLRGALSGAMLAGSWTAGLALFVYAAGFSFAYVTLPAATGALLLFAAVQITMIGRALWTGERLRRWQWLGLTVAVVGVAMLLLPGAGAAPVAGSTLMVAAGVGWGVYSLIGKGSRSALRNTAANFVRTLPFAAVLSLLFIGRFSINLEGASLAAASGALTSALGYALWYAALPHLRATSASTLQLSVPILTALAGVVLLAEPIDARMWIATACVIGGIYLVLRGNREPTR